MNEEQERLLEVLEEYFEEDGEQRLGQLIVNAARNASEYHHSHGEEDHICPFYIQDEDVIEEIEEYIFLLEDEYYSDDQEYSDISSEEMVKDLMNMRHSICKLKNYVREAFDSIDEAQEWAETPAEFLDGERPIDLYRRGEYEKLITFLAGLMSGSFK